MTTSIEAPALDETSISGRASRFAAVTVVTATLGQVLIFVFYGLMSWNPIMANTLAVLVVAVVGFVISTRFVWTRGSVRSQRSQIAAFVGSALVGLAVSTVAVHVVTASTDHALAANLGSAAGYGLVWVLRFAVLEKFVFTGSQHRSSSVDGP